MSRKILLDGGIGTSLWLLAEEYGIEKVPVWKYNITHPEMVRDLHTRFIDAGSRIILANTFGANRYAVKREPGFAVEETVRRGIEIAREAAKDKDVKVFAAAGPLPVLLEPFGDLSEELCLEIYREQLQPACGRADGILVQTFMDLNMIRIAVQAALETGLPVYASMTFEKVGKTMFGNSVRQFVEEIGNTGIQAIGMNCTLTPETALPVLRQFKEYTDLPLLFKPNAGKPILSADGAVSSETDAETFVRDIIPALDEADLIGGCCGADWNYIRKLKENM